MAIPKSKAEGARTFWPRFNRTHLGWFGLAIVAAFVLMAASAPMLAPYSPTKQTLTERLRPPSFAHLLGTDELGRDILSRILFGARVSLRVGILSVGIAVLGGVFLGLIAGYCGGWADSLISRALDALLAFPALILALAITAVLGPGLNHATVAIGVIGIPACARLTRGQVLSIKEREFVEAARAIGCSNTRIIVRHILPNVAAPLIVQASVGMAFSMLAEASLSFLGLGVQPPTPSWGAMIHTGMRFLEVAPWIGLVPAATIFLAVLGFNFLGDGIRDALDPRVKL
jgi:ABC-type dipeptide/oligopeptide/nickel transport system permease subunit